MKQESAASIKRRLKHGTVTVLAHQPRAGTKLRKLYDYFMESKGRPVPFSIKAGDREERNKAHRITVLREIYGLDIRSIRHGLWILAGEWCGRGYVDYVADALAVADSAEEASQLRDLRDTWKDEEDDDGKNVW